MARKKHRRKKAHRRKRSKSVGKRARKYYVSVKRNKTYSKKRKKRSHAGTQISMFGPRKRRHKKRRSSKGAHHGMGAVLGAHNLIVGR